MEACCSQGGPQDWQFISSAGDLPVSSKRGSLDVALYVIAGLWAHVEVGYTAQGRLTMNCIDLTMQTKPPPSIYSCVHNKIHITISVCMSQWRWRCSQRQKPVDLPFSEFLRTCWTLKTFWQQIVCLEPSLTPFQLVEWKATALPNN